MKKRIVTVLVAAIVCLSALQLILSNATSAAAAQVETSGAPAVVETPTVPVDTPAVPEVVTADEKPAAVRGPIDDATAKAAGVSLDVLHMALSAVQCAVASGDISAPPTLTLIDYSRPSTDPRLWVFDMRSGEMLFHELVAHGRGTGDNMAVRFSDQENSHQSSLGLFVTRDTYVGHNGYSLRLHGLEPGFNSRALERAIVMHGAAYVNADFAAKQGRLGRSWGCPAVRQAVARKVIDTVRGGGVIFSYYPDQKWLKSSRFVNCAARAPKTNATN